MNLVHNQYANSFSVQVGVKRLISMSKATP